MTPFFLYLLRHGAPVITGRLLGRTDLPTTADGIRTCRARAVDLDIQAVIGSDLSRARSASEAIGADLGIPVAIDARWRELDFGAWDGLPPDAVDPAAFRRFQADPDRDAPPGGETWSALLARVTAAIAAVPVRATLVVTHGGAMRAALAALCGLDHRHVMAFDLPYASLLTLKVWPGDPRVAQITALS